MMFNLPRDDRSSIADWIELELEFDDSRSTLSKATVASVLGSLGFDDDEAKLTDVWRLLERRSELYNPPPFQVSGDLVTKNDERPRCYPYTACLLFSLYGVRTQRSDPKLLERIGAACISHYLDGKSFVFGWPVLEGIEINIQKRLEQLCDEMREKLAAYPQMHYKDRGVDIVSWKAFNEGQGAHRSGQVVILSQCAAGQDWKTKRGDVPLEAWKQYIHWAAAPIRGFVVPGVVHDESWHDTSLDCGLLFDRIRLFNNIPQPFLDDTLLDSIKEWVDQEIVEAAG